MTTPARKPKPRSSVNLGPRVHRIAKRIADREQRTIVATIERALALYDARATEGSKT